MPALSVVLAATAAASAPRNSLMVQPPKRAREGTAIRRPDLFTIAVEGFAVRTARFYACAYLAETNAYPARILTRLTPYAVH